MHVPMIRPARNVGSTAVARSDLYIIFFESTDRSERASPPSLAPSARRAGCVCCEEAEKLVGVASPPVLFFSCHGWIDQGLVGVFRVSLRCFSSKRGLGVGRGGHSGFMLLFAGVCTMVLWAGRSLDKYVQTSR